MMTGMITADRKASLHLTVRGPQGREQRVEAVVDTGFNGDLTLPPAFVAALQLLYHSQTLAELADGSRLSLREYEATIDWDGQLRDVLVLEAGGSPLIGMALLYGHHMTMDIVDGGPVTIAKLP